MTQINPDQSMPGNAEQPAAISLSEVEARVLGVLVEKEKTTPDQYPLTINSLMNGANQKNNRQPVTDYDEDEIREAINSLRHKGLAMQSDSAGSRVSKYRHIAAEKLGISTRELVVLTELLLRGPQTLGELRGRASRMLPLESLEMVRSTVEQLRNKQPALVREMRPAPGSRAERYAQLLCQESVEEASESEDVEVETVASSPGGKPALADRVNQLETEVATLREAIKRLAASLGNEDPFGGSGGS